jgi:hypothetical protein
MNTCNKCGNLFDHYETFYTDICDPCAEKSEGKSLAELEKEDAKFDDVVLET